ncbi:hypothetical protein LINPERHAP1_LOCUS25262, partial [Linum perenne]
MDLRMKTLEVHINLILCTNLSFRNFYGFSCSSFVFLFCIFFGFIYPNNLFFRKKMILIQNSLYICRKFIYFGGFH